MEHERNALAIMEAIERLTDPSIVAIFARLEGINERYPTDDDVIARFRGSKDEEDLSAVATFVETVACLARRKVLDPSLIVCRWSDAAPKVEFDPRFHRTAQAYGK